MTIDETPMEAAETGPQGDVEAPEPLPEDNDTGSDDDGQDGDLSGNREAAKWRLKLRQAETEREAEREQWTVERGLLAAKVEHMQRQEAERIAAATLTAPGDMWLGGTELADLLDDSGDLDPAKVTKVANRLASERRHWKRNPTVRNIEGFRSGASGNQIPAPTSWRDALSSAESG